MDKNLWEWPVEGKEGVRPKFKVVCPTCFIRILREKVLKLDLKGIFKLCKDPPEMFLRYSKATHLDTVGEKARACNMHYKCFRCDQVFVYGVAIDDEHYRYIYEQRGNSDVYCPVEKWREDEEMRKQLESLGYI